MNRTPIEWTHWSDNPFKMRMPDGTLINVCVHKSDGCRNCYAEMIVKRFWRKEWGEFPGYTAALLKLGTPVLVEEELQAVLRLSKRIAAGKADQQLNKIFWSDMTDEYLEFWPDEFIDKCFAVRALTSNLIHQILTKRPDRMLDYMKEPNTPSGQALPNVWLGVSVEDQKTADERIPLLLQTPAAVRWISAEPLLGPVDLRLSQTPDCNCLGGHDAGCAAQSRVGWVVCGGESGPKARPANPEWVYSLRNQCEEAEVPFFFKQWGEWFPRQEWEFNPDLRLPDDHDAYIEDSHTKVFVNKFDEYYPVHRVGKKAAGRLLDGREWSQFPEVKASA